MLSTFVLTPFLIFIEEDASLIHLLSFLLHPSFASPINQVTGNQGFPGRQSLGRPRSTHCRNPTSDLRFFRSAAQTECKCPGFARTLLVLSRSSSFHARFQPCHHGRRGRTPPTMFGHFWSNISPRVVCLSSFGSCRASSCRQTASPAAETERRVAGSGTGRARPARPV